MQPSSASFRKSFLVVIGIILAGLGIKCQAETVLDQTYYRSSFQNFAMNVEAHHTDDGVGGDSNLYVTLQIVVRDPNGNIYSSSQVSCQFSGGRIEELTFSPDIGMSIIPNETEPGTPGYQALLTLDADFSPPGTFQSTYSIDVTLTKYVDSEDEHDVDYDIW